MQVRGVSFTGRISEIKFAVNISCLAKQRCIPQIHFEINICNSDSKERERLLPLYFAWKCYFFFFLAFQTFHGHMSNVLLCRSIHLKFALLHLCFSVHWTRQYHIHCLIGSLKFLNTDSYSKHTYNFINTIQIPVLVIIIISGHALKFSLTYI